MAPPGGPPGQCYATGAQERRIQWAVGVHGLDTTLDFGDGGRVDLETTSVSLASALPVGERSTVHVGAGVLTGGELRASGSDHDFDPGGLVFAGFTSRRRDADGLSPAVELSAMLGVTWAGTIERGTGREADYSAFDLRFGARTTWRVGDHFFPFAAARVFGGPVSWDLAEEDVTGTDVHHYQLALGAALRLGPTALFAEWAGLGEQGLSVGLGTAW